MPGVNPYPKVSTLPQHVSSNEIHANTEAQAMSMFRASPWVSYDPTPNQVSLHTMDDVDMDAPQISTLREEETPPPQPKASNSRKGKSTKQAKTTEFSAWVRPRQESHTEEEYDEAEEEEDQLIDDDDDEMMKPMPPTALASARPTDSTPKRKASSKRKPRKSEKRTAEDEKKAREKGTSSAVPEPNPAPTMTWFPATPLENPEEASTVPAGESVLSMEASTPKKSPRKTASASRPKGNIKLKLKPPQPPSLADDIALMSEGHTATAASSPRFDDNSSEPDLNESVAPVVEETNLENVPLPLYPLPTKPFPVQLPPKIATGFAPVIPLDKSGKKVRHWRVANREIRGIAGGRWFARSWVGEKTSEYAAAAAAVAAQTKGEAAAVLPKLGTSISAPVTGRGKGKGSKAASSLAASAAPSRAGSSIPDIPTSSTRPPTKMRTILAPPSEGGDSDIMAVTGS